MESYTFDQHRHNYATWTAARAVQRNFTTTSNIKEAIDKSGLKQFVEDELNVSADEFKSYHLRWARSLINTFEERDVRTCTYGRAAKIISIYLKTAVIISNQGSCSRSKFIHPPVDGILLKNLSKLEGLKDLGTKRWTQFSDIEYWGLVDRLNNHFKRFDWTLEFYWSPEQH